MSETEKCSFQMYMLLADEIVEGFVDLLLGKMQMVQLGDVVLLMV